MTHLLLNTSMTDTYVSMRTYFHLLLTRTVTHTHTFTRSHTHIHIHTDTYTHLHAGNCRGGEKQAYLLQGGKEWRRKVKKEKKKEKTRSYTTRQKEKVETESKE